VPPSVGVRRGIEQTGTGPRPMLHELQQPRQKSTALPARSARQLGAKAQAVWSP
jgi:hypothetical protein